MPDADDNVDPPCPSASPLSYQPNPKNAPLRLTSALRSLLQECDAGPQGATGDSAASTTHRPLTLGLIIDTTGERAFGVLMAFLCLPFLTPIPLPGVSIPFGLALVLLGAQLVVRKHRPWLPRRFQQWRLPPKLGPRLIAFIAKLFKPLERVVRPRLLIMQNPGAMVVVGVALMVDGFLLALPLPPVVPFSNGIPAWMALLKIIGMTEEDGIFMMIGTLMTALAVAGIIILIVLGWGTISSWWS